MELQSLLEFIKFTHAFQQVKRSIYATGEDRFENDAEHSYQMSLVCWYIITTQKLNLNIDRVMRYCIVHDLVEAYAGDTPNFGEGSEAKASKHEREHAALLKIKETFTEFPELFEMINEYELQQNQEAKFVYALDKMISILNIYLDNGRSWFKNGVTLEKLIDNKRSRIEVDPTILKIFDKVLNELQDKKELFPTI